MSNTNPEDYFKTPTILNDLVSYVNLKELYVCQAGQFETNQYTRFKYLKNKIVVAYWPEYNEHAYLEDVLKFSKEYFDRTGKLNNYFIFLSVHDYEPELKEKYSDFFTLIVDPLLYAYFTETKDIPNIALEPKIDKKLHFLALNSRASIARQSLYYFFKKYNLQEKSYFTYHGNLKKGAAFKSYDQIADICTNNNPPWYLADLDLYELNKKIPVTIAGDNFGGNDWSPGTDFYYPDTFCSLVFEAYDDNTQAHLTEKSFKAIAFYHPFIIYSNPGTLKVLQDLGFKTFGDFWDESYDSLSAHHRLEAVFRLVLEISNWSQEKINQVYNKMLPILEHNHNHFFQLSNLFNATKPELYSRIKTIAESKKGLLG